MDRIEVDYTTDKPKCHLSVENLKTNYCKTIFLRSIVFYHCIRVLLIQKTFYLSFWMQPGQDKQSGAQSSERTTPSSSISSLGDGPYSPGKTARSGKSRGNDSDSESEPGGTGPIVPGPVTNGFSNKGNEDPALKEVMSQISSSFPPDQKSEWGGTVKRVFVSWLMFVVSD